MTFVAGDRVMYVAAPVYDLIITTGEVGVVTRVDADWVHATWPRAGEHSVPTGHVRPAYEIEVVETSAGAYLVTGSDSAGRSCQLRGEDDGDLTIRVVSWLDDQNKVRIT